MINIVIIGNDIYQTKEILKRITNKNLISTQNFKSKISKFLGIKESDLLLLDNASLNSDNFLLSENHKNKILALSVNSKPKITQYKNTHAKYKLPIHKRNKVIKELSTIGFNFKLKGTNYLIDTILEIENPQTIKVIDLKNDIYPIVAKKHKKTVQNIKNCINSAIEDMYFNTDAEFIQNYFNSYGDIKPTTKQVIFTIANKIIK